MDDFQRAEFLPFHRPWIGEEEIAEVAEVLRSGWLTTGPRTKRFEAEFASYLGARHAVAMNSCTAALHVGLAVAGVSPGDEVITSPITFPATANVVLHLGAKPVFVDVERDTLNIDASRIEVAITPRTRAIVPVHFAGHPCDMDPILDIARRRGLVVVEDAAHAIESRYKGRKIGTIGDMTAFSFYATKNITTGEGGMLTYDEDRFDAPARMLSLHGISKDAWKRYSASGYQHWETEYAGYKYNMFDVQAAIGLHQMKRVEQFHARRVAIMERYRKAFAGHFGLSMLAHRPDIVHAEHVCVVLLHLENLTATRDEIMNEIQARNVGIGIHFRSLHVQKFYREKFGFRPDDFPNARWATDRVLSLPLYPRMSDEDVEDVIRVVNVVLERNRKR